MNITEDPQKKPEMLVKLLILKYLYNLSDVQVINETNINLAYKWFIGLSPEDELPSPSLLAKFRTHKLKGSILSGIFDNITTQCSGKIPPDQLAKLKKQSRYLSP